MTKSCFLLLLMLFSLFSPFQERWILYIRGVVFPFIFITEKMCWIKVFYTVKVILLKNCSIMKFTVSFKATFETFQFWQFRHLFFLLHQIILISISTYFCLISAAPCCGPRPRPIFIPRPAPIYPCPPPRLVPVPVPVPRPFPVVKHIPVPVPRVSFIWVFKSQK